MNRLLHRVAAGLANRLIAYGQRRAPDYEIGGSADPYLRRWYLWPRNRICNAYLHEFCKSDDPRALHDHPWPNVSVLLSGSYIEVTFAAPPQHGAPLPRLVKTRRVPFHPVFRRAAAAHRVELLHDCQLEPVRVWSLFLTGPQLRSCGPVKNNDQTRTGSSWQSCKSSTRCAAAARRKTG